MYTANAAVRRLAVAATGLVLSAMGFLAVGCTSANPVQPTDSPSHPTSITTSPATPQSSAPATLAAPRVVNRATLTHTGEPAAAWAAGSTLFVAFRPPGRTGTGPNPGTLVEYDLVDSRVIREWHVGGSPVAVVANSQRVWVADDAGDGTADAPNRVLEFDFSGRMLHTYAVAGPVALALGTGSSAWVEYGGDTQTGHVRLLHDGAADAATTLVGSNVDGEPLLACGANVYATSEDAGFATTHVQRLQPPAQADVAGGGGASLACASAGVLLLVPHTGIYRLDLASTPGPASGPTDNNGGSLVSADGTLWMVGPTAANGVGVWELDSSSENPLSATTIPQAQGGALAVGAGTRLCVITDDPAVQGGSNGLLITEFAS
jgi:hypothetical protein